MTGKSGVEADLRNTFLLKSVTGQHTQIKTITYLLLIKKIAKR
jgi:hypothetical protein